MKKPRQVQMVISDDLPEAYLRRLLGDRIARDTPVFSRADAIHTAEGRGGNRLVQTKRDTRRGFTRR